MKTAVVCKPAILLAAHDGADVPEELVIFPPGVIKTMKYEPFIVDAEAAAQIISNFRNLGRDLPIDFEHATHLPEHRTPSGEAPAAGWITDLAWDVGRGLVASVNWTDRAAARISAREYRYFSPTGIVDETGDVRRFVELWSVALTNDPATLDIAPIAATRYGGLARVLPGGSVALVGGLMMLEQLWMLLGLEEGASLDQVSAALTDDKIVDIAAILQLGEDATKQSILAKIGELLGFSSTGDPTADAPADNGDAPPDAPGPVGAVSDMSRASVQAIAARLQLGPVETIDQLVNAAHNAIKNPKGFVAADAHQVLLKRLETLELSNQTMAFDAVVDNADNRGRIPPTERDAFFAMFITNRKTFDTILNRLPKIGDRKISRGDGAEGDGPTAGRHAFLLAADRMVTERKVTMRQALSIVAREQKGLHADYKYALNENAASAPRAGTA